MTDVMMLGWFFIGFVTWWVIHYFNKDQTHMFFPYVLAGPLGTFVVVALIITINAYMKKQDKKGIKKSP